MQDGGLFLTLGAFLENYARLWLCTIVLGTVIRLISFFLMFHFLGVLVPTFSFFKDSFLPDSRVDLLSCKLLYKSRCDVPIYGLLLQPLHVSPVNMLQNPEGVPRMPVSASLLRMAVRPHQMEDTWIYWIHNQKKRDLIRPNSHILFLMFMTDSHLNICHSRVFESLCWHPNWAA